MARSEPAAARPAAGLDVLRAHGKADSYLRCQHEVAARAEALEAVFGRRAYSRFLQLRTTAMP